MKRATGFVDVNSIGSVGTVKNSLSMEHFIWHHYRKLSIHDSAQTRPLERCDQLFMNIEVFWDVKPCGLVSPSSGSIALFDPEDVSTNLPVNTRNYFPIDAA